MEIYMKSKRSGYDAYGIYDNGTVIVQKGSKICLHFAETFKRANSVVAYRKDSSYVDKSGYVLQDCIFTSPSTAAQFVNGRSTNGYIAWRIDEKSNLRQWLQLQQELKET